MSHRPWTFAMLAVKRADVAAALAEASKHGLSWAKVGRALGTSGQAASERYATHVPASR